MGKEPYLDPYVFTALGGLLGLLAGIALNRISYHLPIILERQWQAEAQCALGLHRADDSAHGWSELIAPIAAESTLRLLILAIGASLATMLVAWHFGPTAPALPAIFLTWCLLTLSLIDAEHQLLPDVVVMPFLWLGLAVNTFGFFTGLSDALWGAIWGYLSLWSVYWFFRLISGREGLGYGDFKLFAMIGAWCGWQGLPLCMLIAAAAGSVSVIALRCLGKSSSNAVIPFGPFLAAGGWVSLLWGREAISAYLLLLG